MTTHARPVRPGARTGGTSRLRVCILGRLWLAPRQAGSPAGVLKPAEWWRTSAHLLACQGNCLVLVATLLTSCMVVACGKRESDPKWAVMASAADAAVASAAGSHSSLWRVSTDRPTNIRVDLLIDGVRAGSVSRRGVPGSPILLSLSVVNGEPSFTGLAPAPRGPQSQGPPHHDNRSVPHFVLSAIGDVLGPGALAAEPGDPPFTRANLVTQELVAGEAESSPLRSLTAVVGKTQECPAAHWSNHVVAAGGAVRPGVWEPLPPGRALLYYVEWQVGTRAAQKCRWELWISRT